MCSGGGTVRPSAAPQVPGSRPVHRRLRTWSAGAQRRARGHCATAGASNFGLQVKTEVLYKPVETIAPVQSRPAHDGLQSASVDGTCRHLQLPDRS